MFIKKIIKKLFAMLVAQIRKELTIQRPTFEQMTKFERQESHGDRMLRNGSNGIAMVLLICAVMAWLVL